MTYKPGDEVVVKADIPDHPRGWRAVIDERKRRRLAVSSGNEISGWQARADGDQLVGWRVVGSVVGGALATTALVWTVASLLAGVGRVSLARMLALAAAAVWPVADAAWGVVNYR
jgi:hypothetical protein